MKEKGLMNVRTVKKWNFGDYCEGDSVNEKE